MVSDLIPNPAAPGGAFLLYQTEFEPPAIGLFAEQSALPKPQPDLAASKPEKGS